MIQCNLSVNGISGIEFLDYSRTKKLNQLLESLLARMDSFWVFVGELQEIIWASFKCSLAVSTGGRGDTELGLWWTWICFFFLIVSCLVNMISYSVSSAKLMADTSTMTQSFKCEGRQASQTQRVFFLSGPRKHFCNGISSDAFITSSWLTTWRGSSSHTGVIVVVTSH